MSTTSVPLPANAADWGIIQGGNGREARITAAATTTSAASAAEEAGWEEEAETRTHEGKLTPPPVANWLALVP